jgi:hypothetical protein
MGLKKHGFQAHCGEDFTGCLVRCDALRQDAMEIGLCYLWFRVCRGLRRRQVEFGFFNLSTEKRCLN